MFLPSLWLAVAGLFVFSAYNDSQTMRIPNWVSIAIIGLYALRWLVAPETVDPLNDLKVMGLVFVGGFALYAARWFGAGDIKLLTVGALWFGEPQLMVFLGGTAILGAILSLMILTVRHIEIVMPYFARFIPAMQKNKYIPYGIAIAAGALLALNGQLEAWKLVSWRLM